MCSSFVLIHNLRTIQWSGVLHQAKKNDTHINSRDQAFLHSPATKPMYAATQLAGFSRPPLLKTHEPFYYLDLFFLFPATKIDVTYALPLGI